MTKSKAIIDTFVESDSKTIRRVRNGIVYWRTKKGGKLHRINGPAVEFPDGTKYWYKNDIRHRLNGPAIQHADGDDMYYVDGRRFTENEFYKYVDQGTGEVFAPPGKRLYYDPK